MQSLRKSSSAICLAPGFGLHRPFEVADVLERVISPGRLFRRLRNLCMLSHQSLGAGTLFDRAALLYIFWGRPVHRQSNPRIFPMEAFLLFLSIFMQCFLQKRKRTVLFLHVTELHLFPMNGAVHFFCHRSGLRTHHPLFQPQCIQ